MCNIKFISLFRVPGKQFFSVLEWVSINTKDVEEDYEEAEREELDDSN
jgi:hypothetical protein